MRRADGSPLDAMLHLFWQVSGGVSPLRLLEDGCPSDRESGGHGVLFAAHDPARALRAVAAMVQAWSAVEEFRSAA